MKQDKLIQAALDAGATGAAMITGADVVLSEEFREICRTGQCGGYGMCWMCPPDIGPIGELMERVREYPYALVYQTIGQLEDSFDIEGMFRIGQEHAFLGQRVQEKVQPLLSNGFLHLSCGGCHLCPTCAKRTEEPCRHPDKALPAMEGYGVDVYNTVKHTPLKYTNGENTVTYFGMVLFKE